MRIIDPVEQFPPYKVRWIEVILEELGPEFLENGGDELALFDIVVEIADPRLAYAMFERIKTGVEVRVAFLRSRLPPGDRAAAPLRATGAEWLVARLGQITVRHKSDLRMIALEGDLRSILPALDFNNQVKSNVDPVRLMQQIASPPGDGEWSRLVPLHARFKLAFTIARFFADHADPFSLRALAVDVLQSGWDERILEPGLERRFSIAAECNPVTGRIAGIRKGDKEGLVPQNVRLFEDNSLAREWAAQRGRRRKRVRVKEFRCRATMLINGVRYWVFCDPRAKELLSSIMKTERKIDEEGILTSEDLRDSLMKDGVGGKFVLVAIEEVGAFRLPTHADRANFNQMIAERLFSQLPFRLTKIESNEHNAGHKLRSDEYSDAKVLGTIEHVVRGRTVINRCEVITITVWNHLSTEWSKLDDNHGIRERARVLGFLRAVLPKDTLEEWDKLIQEEDESSSPVDRRRRVRRAPVSS